MSAYLFICENEVIELLYSLNDKLKHLFKIIDKHTIHKCLSNENNFVHFTFLCAYSITKPMKSKALRLIKYSK